MGKDEDGIAENKDAPTTPEEWRVIRSGSDKAHKSWVIVGPIYAVVVNWKALAIVASIVVYLNRPDIIAAIQAFSRAGK